VPLLTVSCSPTVGAPLIVGFTVFSGPFLEATIALGSEVADAFPSALVAVTTTRNVCETSPATGVYAFSAAPVMSPQAVPSLAQRCHW
jgi:hypothetical protein